MCLSFVELVEWMLDVVISSNLKRPLKLVEGDKSETNCSELLEDKKKTLFIPKVYGRINSPMTFSRFIPNLASAPA